MENKYLKIGEMAELNHVSTQTLRLYAKDKLLEPEYLNPETGYRYYTIDQCAKLDLIQTLKNCRLTLEEIRRILAVTDLEELSEILDKQDEKIAQEIYNLSVSRNNLGRIRENIRILNSLPPFGQPYYEYMEERMVDIQEAEPDFFTQGIEGYERMVRHMQNYLIEKQLPSTYFANVGTIIKKEDFEAQNYQSNHAFIFVDDYYPQKDHIYKLKASLYVSIISDDPGKEIEYAQRMYRQIQKNGMEICGDYIFEVLTQIPANRGRKIVYKIQVPIRRGKE